MIYPILPIQGDSDKSLRSWGASWLMNILMYREDDAPEPVGMKSTGQVGARRQARPRRKVFIGAL